MIALGESNFDENFLQALANESSERMGAIRAWTTLLKNKQFLMIFIQTLEEQKKFTVQEK